MATHVVSVSNFSLTSTWTVNYNPYPFTTMTTPTTGSVERNYSCAAIPTGSVITSAILSATLGSPATGPKIKSYNIEGDGVNRPFNGSADVTNALKEAFSGSNKTITVLYRFQANGTTALPTGSRSSSLPFSSNTLIVTYTPPYTAPTVSNIRLASSLSDRYLDAGEDTVTLSWTASAGSYNPVESVTIARSLNGGSYSTLETGVTGSSLQVVKPPAGSRYTYRIIVVGEYSNSEFGYSPNLYSKSFTTAPTGITLDPNNAFTGQTHTVSWSGAGDGVGVPIAGYRVYRKLSSASEYTQLANPTGTSTSKEYAAPDTEGTYNYRVSTVGDDTNYNSGMSSVVANLTVIQPATNFTLTKSVSDAQFNGTHYLRCILNESSYTHRITWKMTNSAGAVQTLQTNNSIAGGATVDLTLTTAMASHRPSDLSGEISCNVETYVNGQYLTPIVKSQTVLVPSYNVTIPTAWALASSSTLGGTHYNLKGVSSYTGSITGASAYGGSIARYEFTLYKQGVGTPYRATQIHTTTGAGSINITAIPETGIFYYNIVIVDSRGKTTSPSPHQAAGFEVINYTLPGVSSQSRYIRCGESSEPDEDGSRVLASTYGTRTTIGANAITAIKLQYRVKGTSSWLPATPIATTVTSNNSVFRMEAPASAPVGGFNTVTSYEILVTVTDSFGYTNTFIATISPATRMFDFRNDRAGIGKVASGTAKTLETPDDWKLRTGVIDLQAATGTAPLIVSSTTKVSNLNVDSLDGYDAAAFALQAIPEGHENNMDKIGGTGLYALSMSSWANGPLVTSYGTVYVNNINATTATQLFLSTIDSKIYVRHRLSSTWSSWSKVWTSSTDGSGSGLDADLLDGNEASHFATAAHNHDTTYLPLSGGTITDNLTVDGTFAAGTIGGANIRQAKTLAAVNANDVTEEWILASNASTNTPSAHYYFLQTITYTSSYKRQMAWGYNTPACWTRHLQNGSWQTWKQFVT